MKQDGSSCYSFRFSADMYLILVNLLSGKGIR